MTHDPIAAVPRQNRQEWKRRSCGEGARGLRNYDR